MLPSQINWVGEVASLHRALWATHTHVYSSPCPPRWLITSELSFEYDSDETLSHLTWVPVRVVGALLEDGVKWILFPRSSRVLLCAFIFWRVDASLSYIGIQKSGDGHILILLVHEFLFLITQFALVNMLYSNRDALSPQCFVLGCIDNIPVRLCKFLVSFMGS